jgi:hypothetical protein
LVGDTPKASARQTASPNNCRTPAHIGTYRRKILALSTQVRVLENLNGVGCSTWTYHNDELVAHCSADVA